jgi:hypothetical protein
MTDTPNTLELRGASYLDRAHALMIEDGLTPDAAFRVVVLHALSKVAAQIGTDEPAALADWLEAQARAMRLQHTTPIGSA